MQPPIPAYLDTPRQGTQGFAIRYLKILSRLGYIAKPHSDREKPEPDRYVSASASHGIIAAVRLARVVDLEQKGKDRGHPQCVLGSDHPRRKTGTASDQLIEV